MNLTDTSWECTRSVPVCFLLVVHVLSGANQQHTDSAQAWDRQTCYVTRETDTAEVQAGKRL